MKFERGERHATKSRIKTREYLGGPHDYYRLVNLKCVHLILLEVGTFSPVDGE